MHQGRLAVAGAGGGVGASVTGLLAWALAHYAPDSRARGHPAVPAAEQVFDHGAFGPTEPCQTCAARCGLYEKELVHNNCESVPADVEEVWIGHIGGVRIELRFDARHRDLLSAFFVGFTIHKGGVFARLLLRLLCEIIGRLPHLIVPRHGGAAQTGLHRYRLAHQ